MKRLGPDVRLEVAANAATPHLRYLPRPDLADLPPLPLHPLVAVVLAYYDAGWPSDEIERHLLSRLDVSQETIHELVADVGVVFLGHFNHRGDEETYVDIGDPEALLLDVAAQPGELLTSRRILFPNDRALFPMNVEWVVTRYCNRACVYCYQGAILNGKPKDSLLSTERVKEILSEARRLGAYNYFITGGEPLLRKDSYDILVHALELGFKPDIVSKQFIADADAARLAAAGLESITLSIDSLDPDAAAQLTGIKPYAERITRTVIGLTGHGIEVHAKMVLTPVNVPTLEMTLDGLEGFGVKTLQIEPYSDNLQRHSDALRLPRDQALEVRALLDRWTAENQMIVGFEVPPESSGSGHTDDHADEHDHGQDCFLCHVSTTALLFQPDGKVGKCDKQLPGDDFDDLGDLSHQSVHEVWNSPKMVEALKPPRELYEGTLCHDCDEFDVCHERARCYYDAYLTSGTLYGPGSNCPYIDADRRTTC